MFGKALLVALLTCVVSLTAGRSTAYAQGAIGQGDPTGAATGTAKDVTVKDAEESDHSEVMETVGHNKIAINFVWTLLAGLPRHVHAGRVSRWWRRASPAPRTPPTR